MQIGQLLRGEESEDRRVKAADQRAGRQTCSRSVVIGPASSQRVRDQPALR